MIEMVQDVLPMTMLDECREIKLADKSHWPRDGVNVSAVAVRWMGIDITHSGCKAGTSTWVVDGNCYICIVEKTIASLRRATEIWQ